MYAEANYTCRMAEAKRPQRVGREGVTAIFWFEHTHAHKDSISSILEWPSRNVKRKHKE